MKEIQLNIPLVDGSAWDVVGFQIGSFAVHTGHNIGDDIWTISHIPTGMNAVNGMCFSKSRAIKIARMLKRVFSDSDMLFVSKCAAILQEDGKLTKEDNLKYQVLYSMMWADRSVSKYAR